MQGKKILYVWQNSYPWEIRAEKITQSLVDAGAQVFILCRKKTDLKTNSAVEILDFDTPNGPAPLPFSAKWAQKIKQIILAKKIDLVIARDILVSPSVISAAKSYGIPKLMDMAEHYPAAMRGWKKYNSDFFNRFLVHVLKFPDFVERYSVRRFDGIITVCKEQEQRLQGLGVNPTLTCSVYNTPELKNFPTPTLNASKELKIFAHHGFLTPERGLDMLIRAFAILKNQGHDLKLIIAGRGESEDDLKSLATTLRAPVTFTGTYSFQEFPKLLSEIDVGILPYQLSEFLDHTVANKLFDYMAAGKPVLVSNTKSLSRIIHETGAGAVIDVNSPDLLAASILDFVKNTTGNEGRAGRKAIEEKYNWSNDRQTLIQFTKKYLGESR